MLPVMEAIHRIRAAVHDDEQRINYSDEEILNAINAGLRVIRRTITDIQPEILMETMTGVLEAGQDEIRLEKRPLMILDVTAGDKVLSVRKGERHIPVFHNNMPIFGNKTPIYQRYETKNFAERKLAETNLQHIRDNFAIGRPKCFYRVGLQNLKVHPKPRVETAFTVHFVADIHELNFDDKTPLLNEFDDFLIEYAIYRLALGDEFDMTQEQQLIANIHQQITSILNPPPYGTVVHGYW